MGRIWLLHPWLGPAGLQLKCEDYLEEKAILGGFGSTVKLSGWFIKTWKWTLAPVGPHSVNQDELVL